MAETTGLFHNLIVTTPDDPTLTGQSLLTPTEWNKSHVLRGGNDGNLLVKDSTQPQGFTWQRLQDNIGGKVLVGTAGSSSTRLIEPAPGINTPVMALTTFTLALTSTIVLLNQATVSDAGAGIKKVTLSFQQDGITVRNYNILNQSVFTSIVDVFSLPPGVHTYGGFFITDTPFILNSFLAINILIFN